MDSSVLIIDEKKNYADNIDDNTKKTSERLERYIFYICLL